MRHILRQMSYCYWMEIPNQDGEVEFPKYTFSQIYKLSSHCFLNETRIADRREWLLL